MLLHVVHHSIVDGLRLFPFLFVVYLLMELIQNSASERSERIIMKAGKTGPVWGSLLGALPQCGFSAGASFLYAGRVITIGTLIAIYMSTSDEMLPILIAEQVPVGTIVKIIAAKVVIGMISGFLIQLLFGWMMGNDRMPESVAEEYRSEDKCCCCDHSRGLIGSAFIHSLQVWVFIVLISIVLGFVVHSIGEETIAHFVSDIPVLGEIIAGLVGLIPNCGASVVITKLYIDGIIGTGPMMSGLLVSAGVGLLVLFKENRKIHENIFIVIVLYAISVGWGVLFDILNISF